MAMLIVTIIKRNINYYFNFYDYNSDYNYKLQVRREKNKNNNKKCNKFMRENKQIVAKLIEYNLRMVDI